MMRKKQKQEKANTVDEASKSRGQTPNEILPIQTFDEYQCSGNVEIDFPRLCALLDIKDIPAVSTRQRDASNTETEGAEPKVIQSLIGAASPWFKPHLQVELDNEDLSAKNLKISGWRVDKQIAKVLERMLPSLGRLQNLQFWQAGLTDETVLSLLNTTSLCSNLSSVTLEGNPLPKQSFHLLLSKDSLLTHLSLRNNHMGDEGARLIGSALSTARSANKKLLILNLSFNSIGDAGAAHIAKGLRLNRTLLFLSLSNNRIGDTGAAHLTTTMGKFALTHEEVVERRKLLLERAESSSVEVDLDQSPPEQLPSVPSSSSLSGSKGKKKEALKKAEKPVATKENPKPNKKATEVKSPQSKDTKLGGKEKQLPAQEQDGLTEQQVEETVSPLLDPLAQRRNGEIILPGNRALISLNLAGNRITEESLPLFLEVLLMQGQDGGGGLLRLCLQRNRFPSDCKCYVKIQELMKCLDPLAKKENLS